MMRTPRPQARQRQGQERGILGVRKDPRHQMLFSFNVRPGDEWASDDSEDSDYDVGADSNENMSAVPAKVRRLRHKWKSRSPSGRRKQQQANDKLNNEMDYHRQRASTHGHKLWGTHLPQEILLRIFQQVVATEGSLPFLCRASRVCRLWRTVAMDLSLWQRIDLSPGWIRQVPKTLRWLADFRTRRLRHLDLTWWNKINLQDYRFLFDSCRELQSLSLSYNSKLTPCVITDVSALPRLTSLTLSAVPASITCQRVLCPMLEKLGSRLLSLNLSRNKFVGFHHIFTSLMDSCPNLELLDLSFCKFSASQTTVDIERFQQSCPRLKVLRLENTPLCSTHVTGVMHPDEVGFPDLEELSVPITDYRYASVFTYQDDTITRLLRFSSRLERLDVNMCVEVSENSLTCLAATDLQYLRIARCSSGRVYTGLENIVAKWKHSLRSLHVSWNTFSKGSLDDSLRHLAAAPASPIETISLSGTSVSTAAVRSDLQA